MTRPGDLKLAPREQMGVDPIRRSMIISVLRIRGRYAASDAAWLVDKRPLLALDLALGLVENLDTSGVPREAIEAMKRAILPSRPAAHLGAEGAEEES